MRLLVQSYFPPLRSHIAGGAQQFLHDLICRFAGLEVDVEVLCPDAEGQELLDAGPTVTIQPVQIEPGLGPLAPYQRHWNAQQYVLCATRAEAVLSIDRGVPAQVDVPVVLSLNNFSYATEVEAVFGLAWDEVIVPSSYLAHTVAAVMGPQAWDGSGRRIHTIPYGVDLEHLRPCDPVPLAARLGLDMDRRFVLFPHRPEPQKGFALALAAIELAGQADPRFQLLVPLPPRSVLTVRDQEETFVTSLRATIRDRGIADAVAFHPWIPLEDLPAYFSLGTACLALGTFPESFGFTPVQSVACGTPVVATPAGAIPTLLPSGCGMVLVPFDDPVAAAEALGALPSPSTVATGRAWVAANYPPSRTADEYLRVLSSARRHNGAYQPRTGEMVRAPWCRALPSGGVWHDYESKQIGLDLTDGSDDDLQRRGLMIPRFEVGG